ncbi:hypothetical protein Tco_0523999 [Tanacetum coccineum]
MSSAEYDNQFFNDSSDIFLVGILKDPLETETQSMVDVPVHKENLIIQRTPLVDAIISMFPEKTTPTQIPPTTEAQVTNVSESDSSLTILQRLSELEMKVKELSKVDHAEAIEESIQANIINEVKNQLPKYLPKAVSNYVKPRMESKVRDVLQKNSINLFQSSSTQSDSLTEHELKNKLFDRMKKSGSFLEHEKHLELYNDLIGSIGLDEAIAKVNFIQQVLKKRHHDDKDQDPPANSEKEKKRRRRKDTRPSNKQTTSIESSKCAEMDVEELVEDDVVNVEEQPQDDVAPKRDNSIWFINEKNGFDSENSIQRINFINTPYLVTHGTTNGNDVKREHLYSASANEIDEKKPELKNLPQHLEYAYLQGDKSFPIIVSSELSDKEKISLLQVLERQKGETA